MLAAAIIPVFGWRALFLVGTLPALVTVWIRRGIPEPEIWRDPSRRRPAPSAAPARSAAAPDTPSSAAGGT